LFNSSYKPTHGHNGKKDNELAEISKLHSTNLLWHG